MQQLKPAVREAATICPRNLTFDLLTMKLSGVRVISVYKL